MGHSQTRAHEFIIEQMGRVWSTMASREVLDAVQAEANFDRIGFGQVAALMRQMAPAIGMPTPSDGDAYASGMLLWLILRWQQGGRKTFLLSEPLTRQLLLTNVRGVETRWLQLPYPVIYVEVPPGLLENTGFSGQTYSVEGILMSMAGRLVDPEGQYLVLNVVSSDGTGSYIRLHMKYATVEEAVADAMAEVTGRNPSCAGYDPGLIERVGGTQKLAERVLNESQRALSVGLNTLLYIVGSDDQGVHMKSPLATACAQARRAGPKKQKKLEQRMEGLSKAPRILLGSTIVIRKELAEDQDAELQAIRTGKKLTCRFTVRGHWRQQAHGEGRLLRKPMWIAPYWKGPRDARELVQRYIVE